ncbi:MAG TPA: aldose 1-epimerase family protein [Pirellulales bacterium]|nr:aldose 1-epimerase family protein [Pirellulales bacterium]
MSQPSSLQTWTLTDVERDVCHADFEVKTAGDFSIRTRTLHGGLREGVEVVEVDNGCLRFTIVPTRGMGLWRLWRGDLELAWPSPVKGPVHPKFVPVAEHSGIGWLSGFDELLCRCGLESNGAPEWGPDGKLVHPLHGRIANLPAHKVVATFDAAVGQLTVRGVVDEARLFGNNLRLTSTFSTPLGKPRLTIVDEIENISARPAELELLYHINLGPPLATAGSRIDVPVATMAPKDAHSARDLAVWQTYPPEQAGVQETVLFFELATDAEGRTGVLLADPTGQNGVGLRFNRRQFPYFTLWKNPQALVDGYCTGLEPCINFPNTKSFEQSQGRVAVLAAGESRRFEIEIEVHDTAETLCQAREAIAQWQRGTQPKIHDRARPDWSPQ